MSTMDANGERIRGLLESGRQLVSGGNIHAEKIQEKADSIERRYGDGEASESSPACSADGGAAERSMDRRMVVGADKKQRRKKLVAREG